MYIPAVGPGCGEGFLGCIRNGMPAALKRASNFTASRGAYVPSSTKSVCSGLSDFMRVFRRQFVVYFCRHRSKFAGEDGGYMSDKIGGRLVRPLTSCSETRLQNHSRF